MTVQFQKGDRFEWSRSGEKDHGTVEDVRGEGSGQEILITVDGWATGGQPWGWEKVGYSFRRLEKGDDHFISKA